MGVSNLYGCHCYSKDSSFKRYNRAHLGGDTVIFNYNSGNNYNACCGGSCGGGNWFSSLMTGFGLGIGNCFGNMFGGFGMGSMFGGFNMGNMFGGFPSWGNFGSWNTGNIWGLGGGTTDSNAKTKTKTVKQDNKDYSPLKELSKDVDDLNKKIEAGKATQDEIDKLKAKLTPYTEGKNLDGIQDDTDKNFAKEILARLKTLDASNGPSNLSSVPTTAEAAKTELAKMDGAALDKITQDDAKKWLKALGLIDGDYVKFPNDNDIRVLFLIEKSGLNATVAHNSQATADGGYIRGQITDVAAGGKSVKDMTKDELNNPSKISYKVNNGTITDDYGLIYSFESTNNGDYKITKIKNTGSQKYYIKDDFKTARVYTKGSPLTINAVPLVSKEAKSGYSLLEINAEL